jgi:hypothetical protein
MTLRVRGIRVPRWLAARVAVEFELEDVTSPVDTCAHLRPTGRQRLCVGRMGLPYTREPYWSIE